MSFTHDSIDMFLPVCVGCAGGGGGGPGAKGRRGGRMQLTRKISHISQFGP